MSILSYGPSTTHLAWTKKAKSQKERDQQEIAKEEGAGRKDGEEKKQRPDPKPQGRKSASTTWFAPEFDGLNFFETIVSH
ncbi:hypothetical protein KSP39_PZI008537 [Platanthera zijinensis]|uniref:Uncharacterized protein n=1 Tax=Platanthera zijinensis TaxID=2320716 RepID=A0AAP0BP09_9ASPA